MLRGTVADRFFVRGLYEMNGEAMDLARASDDPLPYFVVAQVLRTVANAWDENPIPGQVVADTKQAIAPRVEALLDELEDWPNSLAVPQLCSELVQALLTSDYKRTAYDQ